MFRYQMLLKNTAIRELSGLVKSCLGLPRSRMIPSLIKCYGYFLSFHKPCFSSASVTARRSQIILLQACRDRCNGFLFLRRSRQLSQFPRTPTYPHFPRPQISAAVPNRVRLSSSRTPRLIGNFNPYGKEPA